MTFKVLPQELLGEGAEGGSAFF